MEVLISDLLHRFERGALTRRGFIQGLAMLTASASVPAVGQAPSQAQTTTTADTAIQGVKIDHVSIQVNDLQRSVAFYEKVFGLKILSEVKDQEIVRLGAEKVMVSLHHKSPTGLVDHFGIGVENFNRERMTQQLKQMGVAPEENPDAGFHVTDPAGLSVQIVPA